MGSGDGVFRFRDDIALAQVVLFSISFLYAVSFRWTRRIGWFCIGVFSILRLVGAGCMLGTVKKDSDGLWAGVFVCESLGIILLIFTLLEMMERMYVAVLENERRHEKTNYIRGSPETKSSLSSVGGFSSSRKSSPGLTSASRLAVL